MKLVENEGKWFWLDGYATSQDFESEAAARLAAAEDADGNYPELEWVY